MKTLKLVIFPLLPTLLLVTSALADSITFYEDDYYGGYSFRVENAGEISNLRDKDMGSRDNFNDEISSIKVYGDFKITLYEHADFQGQSVTINLSRPYLDLLSDSSWDNRISSIKWEPLYTQDEKPAVIFYDQANYRGNSFTINGNGSVSRLIDKYRGSSRKNWNDQIRSVKVFGRNTLVVLYQDSKFKGSRLSLVDDSPNLKGFSAVASSVKVFD